MNDNNNRILELFTKYLAGTASKVEEQEFLRYVGDPSHKEEIQEMLSHSFVHQEETASVSTAGRKRILDHILGTEPVKLEPVKRYFWYRIAVAASILVCLGIALYTYYGGYKELETKDLAIKAVMEDSSKVYLTLADGNRISLSDAANGNIANQSGVIITKSADGTLAYTISDKGNNTGSTAYNIIETPRGEQFQVNLPDGTKVWLNTASSLRYPLSFSATKDRKVTLKGEGYFEVAKDKLKRFIVTTEQQEVEVLGTHFNINAYQGKATKTTLLEGAVRVSALQKIENLGTSVTLKPGQMAVNDNKKINVLELPYAEQEVLWKDGYFVFKNANIKEIMEDLANWYDLKVEYQGDMSGIHFHGNYLRSRSVLKLLKSIEQTNKVRFEIEGRRVIVIEEKEDL